MARALALERRADRAAKCNRSDPKSSQYVMPTTPTLKNVPDAVYERLKASAQSHRRSLNSEAIVCLEAVLLPTRMTPVERLARARELRAALPKGTFCARDINAVKRADRP